MSIGGKIAATATATAKATWRTLLGDGLGRLHADDAKHRADYVATDVEEARLVQSLPPPEDVLDGAGRVLTTLGDGFWRLHWADICRSFGGSVQPVPGGARLVIGPQLPEVVAGPWDARHVGAFLSAVFLDGLRARLAAMPYAAGPRMADRPALLASVDETRARIERDHTELVEAASGAGFTLELLPTVVARRAVEANRREGEAHAAADAARTERLRGRS